MSLSEDLKKDVADIFREQWTTRDGQVVPDDSSLKLSNDGILLDATVLYADLADSTEMVDTKKSTFAAAVYKVFLRCACKIIRDHGGVITAFDGDRVMAVFIGDMKNTTAVKVALKIKYAVFTIINPAIKLQYPSTDFVMAHGAGIDTSKLLVAKTGIRGSNDLVWVGSAANHAAKLSGLREDKYSTWISKKVFDAIADEAKFSKGVSMWESRTWKLNNQTIYRSSYYWSF